MKALGLLTLIFSGVLGFIALCVVFSMWATVLWYCFDDSLATLTGYPALGNLSFFTVWPATLFISALFKSQNIRTSNMKD